MARNLEREIEKKAVVFKLISLDVNEKKEEKEETENVAGNVEKRS